jgi:hypothetical protein
MSLFTDRLIRAAKLDSRLYEEVEADTGAMGQAMGTVILSSVAAGVGTIVRGGAAGILAGTVFALIGWYFWAYVTYFIGARLLPEPQTQSNPRELMRTIGFASAPGLIRIAGVIPGFTGFVFFVASVWMFAAMVVGVRQALDYRSTLRALVVCLAGWLIQSALLYLLLLIWR